MFKLSTFIIVHPGRAFAPATIRSQGLLLGQASGCGLQLTDPLMPPVVAGIKEIEGHFYLVRIEPSRFDETKQLSITINGREVMGEAVLAAGDTLVIGGYRLTMDQSGNALKIDVTHLEEGVAADPSGSAAASGGAKSPKAKTTPRILSTDRGVVSRKTSSQLEQWMKRHRFKTRQKVAPLNELKPLHQETNLGTQYNWSPTRDLALPWPASFLLSSLLGVGALTIVTFIVWPAILAPGKVSSAHTQTQLSPSLLIAAAPNGKSCVHCHKLRGAMDLNCVGCHQAAGFHASVTKGHEVAGLTCTSCHREHMGRNFSAKATAFSSCDACHNDNNKQTYNGKTVHTPHDGTFGYPKSDGQWVWPGLSEEALKLKPEVAAQHFPDDTEQQWRSKQFHAIHLYRVSSVPGIEDIKDGVLQCSSCHNRFGAKLDRETPRHTCGKCHNGYVDSRKGRVFVDANKPNCTSCHVQHNYDIYRWGNLLTESEQEKRQRAIDKNYANAVKRSALPR